MRTIPITSRTSSTVRHLLEIKKHASADAFVVEGARFIQDLDPSRITEIATTDPVKYADFLNGLPHARIYEVTQEVMQKLCEAVSGQELLCVTSKPVLPQPDKLLLLDAVQDPGNVGTIIRTAYAFGFGVVLSHDSANPYAPKIVGSTAGTIEKCYVMREPLDREIARLKMQHYTVIASVLDEKAHSPETLRTDKIALVIGNEGNGISAEIQHMADVFCYIPMKNSCNSLNASVAAGILTYLFA